MGMRQSHPSCDDRFTKVVSVFALVLWCFMIMASLRDRYLFPPVSILVGVHVSILGVIDAEIANKAYLLDLAVLFALCVLFLFCNESNAFCCVVSKLLTMLIFANAYPFDEPETVEVCDSCTP